MAKQYLDLTGLTTYDGLIKQWVNSIIDALKNGSFQIVESLPEPSAASPMIIYLVATSSPSGQNNYDEYILVNNQFEKIGSTSIDLSGYATQTWVNEQISTAVSGLASQTWVTSQLANYVQTSTLANYSTTAQMNTAIDNATAAIPNSSIDNLFS